MWQNRLCWTWPDYVTYIWVGTMVTMGLGNTDTLKEVNIQINSSIHTFKRHLKKDLISKIETS